MGRFAAKFRGFWMERGRGTAIQCTADMGGLTGRKNFLKIFKKGVKNLKMGGARGTGRWHEGTLYRVYGSDF